jgi:hypothetical protein
MKMQTVLPRLPMTPVLVVQELAFDALSSSDVDHKFHA